MKKNALFALFVVAACFASTTTAKPDQESQEGGVWQNNDLGSSPKAADDEQEMMIGDTKVTISGANVNTAPDANQAETSAAAGAQQYTVGLLVGAGVFSLASMM